MTTKWDVRLQAMISLERIDAYLTSGELDEAAVERVEGCGDDGIAVEVRGGAFVWDDEGTAEKDKENDAATEAAAAAAAAGGLKGIDIEIRAGALASVVGTVGSGKSSLLSCILGEMRKIAGKVRAPPLL